MFLTKTVVALQITTAVACWIGTIICSDPFEKIILMAMAISATIIATGDLKTYIDAAEIDKLRKKRGGGCSKFEMRNSEFGIGGHGMSRDKQIEEMPLTDVDILANDINQHCTDLAENYCGGTHCVSCLAHALTSKGYRKIDDDHKRQCTCYALGCQMAKRLEEKVAKEFISAVDETIELLCAMYGDNIIICGKYAELKKKYTEGEK